MDLTDAFAALDYLPAKERLLIGRPVDGGMDWSAGHIDEIDMTYDLGGSVLDAIDDFRSGDGLMRVMIVREEPDGQILIAMGPESRDAIANALMSVAGDLARRHAH
ncbi:hypothetical protein [Cupriavidus basilensis]|uniref:hypothetical protein n=1 Tax=Cupriavidus basilensis TaxID=68895 RepID=UPI0039F716D8